MAKSAKYLLIGSIEACSGKTGIILAIARQLQEKGVSIAYGKPIGTCLSDLAAENKENEEGDIQAIANLLRLSEKQVRSPLLSLDEKTIEQRLQGEDAIDYPQLLKHYIQQLEGDLVFLEGGGTLLEGSIFGLSVKQMAHNADASVLLVSRYTSPLVTDNLLEAKKELGDRLLGVLINDISSDRLEKVQNCVKPFLERRGIAVFGTLPSSSLLRSVSVREIARQLEAQVLCRPDRLDFMVESLTIGAMNVNAALEYFRQGKNKAVVTGSDRTDLQLAALETSTSCLILTGNAPPQPLILSRAEDLEIPILAIDLDTLTTIEIIDRAFGRVRLQEPIKVEYIQKLMAEYFDMERFLKELGI
ncbi:MAG: phosphotransacetylase family protein [Hydrococcus sp. C42_A2020_068]|nr:phosphotransacetylase family protein [Hydrococcus sp. C42_A2020_068]